MQPQVVPERPDPDRVTIAPDLAGEARVSWDFTSLRSPYLTFSTSMRLARAGMCTQLNLTGSHQFVLHTLPTKNGASYLS